MQISHPTGGLPVAAANLPADLAALDPDARLNRFTRIAMVSLGALVLGPVAAAALIPINGAVVASGSVGTASSSRRISHPVGGVIAWIGVREGDRVKRGQLLIRFEDNVSSTDASLSALSTYQLLARRGRLDAERLDANAIRFSPELLASNDPGAIQAMADERKLFEMRRADQAGLSAQLDARIAGYKRQIAGYHSQIAATGKQRRLLEQERVGIESLYSRGLVTLSRRNELERGAASFEGSIAALLAEVGQAEAAITEAREQQTQLGSARRADAANQLAAVESELNQQRVRSVAAGDVQSRTEIRAPTDGIAGKLAFTNAGEVVRPAEPILEVVPSHDSFVVESEIAPADIDQVMVGQAARVRFSAFNQATTPEMRGEVIAVSPDRVDDPNSRRSFYRVRVRLTDPAAARVKLTSGMPAEIFVQTGSRSMLSLLTKPLADQFARAFRHP